MSITKLQIGIAGALAAVIGAGIYVQMKTNAGLRREVAAVREQQRSVVELRAENQQLAKAAAEVELLQRDDVELKRLERLAAEAKKVNQENRRLAGDRDAQLTVQAEIDRMNREGNALVQEYKLLREQAADSELPPAAKAEVWRGMQQKLDAIAAKQRDIRAFTESARAAGWTPPAGALQLVRIAPRRDQPGSSPPAPEEFKLVPLR
jgi:hypothetical protein